MKDLNFFMAKLDEASTRLRQLHEAVITLECECSHHEEELQAVRLSYDLLYRQAYFLLGPLVEEAQEQRTYHEDS